MQITKIIISFFLIFLLLFTNLFSISEEYIGVLYIPNVGIEVPLYTATSGKEKQNIVDRKDSAVYFELKNWPGHVLIGDHYNQGNFINLLNVKPNDYFYISDEQGNKTYYYCWLYIDGHNTGKYLSDSLGRNVVEEADILIYTCKNGWKNVRITFWNKIDEQFIDFS